MQAGGLLYPFDCGLSCTSFLPPVLKKITARILAEVPGVCRVLYDLTPKPMGTIEWE